MRWGRARPGDSEGSPEGANETTGEIDPIQEAGLASETGETGETERVRAVRTPLNRTVWVIAAVAVVALGAGMALSRFVISPAQAAAEAEPPEAGLITVPVELRALSSDIVARGDARYDGAVEVTVETSDLGGPAVVTGAVPEVGALLDAGSVALEVAGRPVIVLPGEFPVYRTLLAGATGPDVIQLRDALNALGLEAGGGETYDGAISGAVTRLYERAGYPAPAPAEGTKEALETAQESVRTSTTALEDARKSLTKAGAGASNPDRIRLDNAVNEAQRGVDDAKACAAAPAPTDPETGATLPKDPCPVTVASAEEALKLARAERDEATKAPDTSAEAAAVTSAQSDLDKANEALALAQREVITPMPAGEVIYVSTLPRRVDAVAVKRGTTITAAVMTISGATLEVVANLAKADADLLAVGATAELFLDDTTIPATVTEIAAEPTAAQGEGEGEGGGDGAQGQRVEVVLLPGELTEEQRSALAGSNVRIRIPVSSTLGEVLAVPVAALTAGPAGETRVEVLRQGAEEPELVEVTTGLTASGFAEISSSTAPLEAGDLVVVGR